MTIKLTNRVFLFRFLCFLLSFFFFTSTLNAGFVASDPNEYWITWDSPEGTKRMESSTAKVNFMSFLRYYESQMRPSYCGVATAVIALNALSIEPPESKIFGKFRLFNQEEFFDGAMGTVLDKENALVFGLNLNELALALNTQPVEVEKYEALTMTDDEIRALMISALTDSEKGLIALYSRQGLKQLGDGHWSPVVAYDERTDSFLILDVARHKYPPVWVDAAAFINSMRVPDGELSRGFLILRSTNAHPCAS